jgi:hypothetical protein
MNPALLLDPRGARKKGNLHFLLYHTPTLYTTLLYYRRSTFAKHDGGRYQLPTFAKHDGGRYGP